MKEFAPYLFWLGIVLAAAAPFLPQYTTAIAVIELVIGLVIGFLSLEKKEETPFLIAAIAFLLVVQPFNALVGQIQGIEMLTQWLTGALNVFGWMVAPAAFVVAVRQVVDFMKE